MTTTELLTELRQQRDEAAKSGNHAEALRINDCIRRIKAARGSA